MDHFALAPALSYKGGMAIFPRPVSPKSALGDFWGYFKQQRQHKWPLLGVSIALTYVIVWTFVIDANTNTMPTRNKIIYVQSWDANRSDAAIILQQKIDFAKREAALVKQQTKMQGYADAFGIEWREEEARNTAKRKEAVKAIDAMLDDRLAKAEATGKAGPQASAKPAPAAQP
ncbi:MULTISPECIES: hypothetical protein [Sphingobium]|jgi:hypothetical protein|uniref:Uncharacterized protein n=1 Tax=Sphingobium limneticum TaxID=1007511 RepID=A0A5J5HY63_9SPHN|nr:MULTISPECIES: hypothetical protein [Sphingobium]MBU0933251.1 hypothetical protein [Alphaproteobacteria bacterium]KAA9015013.1 hypothetical protein F4U96_15275 [Sphingobium limneticum]KAA9017296.1 hypothetical protein F4U94_08730 [Sphingobium limneticum]KAA9027937.1 hypothetical protein F4U95_15400 [Sphingobium limneticum]BBD01190.1 hypothetical protein YGS_C1P2445 [Sphingobium sp. YG1]